VILCKNATAHNTPDNLIHNLYHLTRLYSLMSTYMEYDMNQELEPDDHVNHRHTLEIFVLSFILGD